MNSDLKDSESVRGRGEWRGFSEGPSESKGPDGERLNTEALEASSLTGVESSSHLQGWPTLLVTRGQLLVPAAGLQARWASLSHCLCSVVPSL